jgi:histidine phosphotransferase ChpT
MQKTNSDALDFRVMELIVSRLCHDLVSPVGAVNNGVELVDELGQDVLDDAMELIGQSARIASARLGMFRLAFGMAGSGSRVNWRDTRAAAQAYIEVGKATLDWPADSIPSEDASTDFLRYAAKLVLNAIVMTEEAMPAGGAIVVAVHDTGFTISATGRTARLSDELQVALADRSGVDALTARSIHAYMVGHYAGLAGAIVSHGSEPAALGDGTQGERLSITARLKDV